MKKQTKRQHYPNIPKFFQKKVPSDVCTTIAVCHWQNITAFVDGTADEFVLWEWAQSAITYMEMMRLLIKDGAEFTDEAQAAIAEHHKIVDAVANRFYMLGKVGFSGPELAIARSAAGLMDELIAMDKHGIAWASSQFSQKEIEKVKKRASALCKFQPAR